MHDSRNGWDTADAVVSEKGINYPVARDADGASVKAAVAASLRRLITPVDRAELERTAGADRWVSGPRCRILLHPLRPSP